MVAPLIIVVIMTMIAVPMYLSSPKCSWKFIAAETWLVLISSISIPILVFFIGNLIFNLFV